jgi:hypothetical protein
MAGCKGVINTEGNTGDETEEISVARMSEKIDKRLVTEEEQRAQGILLNEMWNWSSPSNSATNLELLGAVDSSCTPIKLI